MRSHTFEIVGMEEYKNFQRVVYGLWTANLNSLHDLQRYLILSSQLIAPCLIRLIYIIFKPSYMQPNRNFKFKTIKILQQFDVLDRWSTMGIQLKAMGKSLGFILAWIYICMHELEPRAILFMNCA